MSSKVVVAHTEAVKNNIIIRIFLDETTKKILVGAFLLINTKTNLLLEII